MAYGPRRMMLGNSRRGCGMRLLPILLFGVFAVYYYFSNQEEVPVTGRKQLVDVNREQAAVLGLQAYRQILSREQVLTDGRDVELVREIGARLEKVVDKTGYRWEFNVVRSEQANAFALPGGKVAIYTGILPIAETVDGLAIIMGHEMAHAVARHGEERMAHQKLFQFGQMAVSMSIGDMDPGTQRAVLGALGVGGQVGYLLPFSRKHESEADYIGLLYAARACFDPRAAPEVWKRMQAHAASKGGKGAPAEFMSTHPAPATRIADFKKWMPEALAIREKHCGKQ